MFKFNIKIDIFYFLIALFIGFLIVYIQSPKPIIILKTPITNDDSINNKIDDKINNFYQHEI